MGIYKLFNSITQYILEAVARTFTPTDDAYPAIGIQPYSDTPFNKSKRADW